MYKSEYENVSSLGRILCFFARGINSYQSNTFKVRISFVLVIDVPTEALLKAPRRLSVLIPHGRGKG